jgi:hypothetical protein
MPEGSRMKKPVTESDRKAVMERDYRDLAKSDDGATELGIHPHMM